jgi:hypothetical protein
MSSDPDHTEGQGRTDRSLSPELQQALLFFSDLRTAYSQYEAVRMDLVRFLSSLSADALSSALYQSTLGAVRYALTLAEQRGREDLCTD